MAASARPGERATSFAVACSLLSRFVRQNGAAAAELGLGITGERGPAPGPGFGCYSWLLLGGDCKSYFLGVCRLRLDYCGKLLFGAVWCEI